LELSVDGRVVLRFCIANGFRNIQNLVRKIKSGKSEYHFVEVMACPGGCLNGGGQIRPSGIETPRELMSRVEALYHQARHRNPEDNPVVRSLYERQFPDAATRYAMLHTGYHAVPKLQNLAAIKW
jgi:iron only hydrogenase large subunit-like protein